MPRLASTSQGAILDAARELGRQQGMGGLTVAAVAAKCGVSEATIYNYVADKAELLRLCVADEETPTALLERLRSDPAIDKSTWVSTVALIALDHLRERLPTLLLRFATEGSEATPPIRERELMAALAAFVQELEGCSSERASAKAHLVMASVSHRVFGELAFSEPVDQRDDKTFVRELSNLLNHPAEAK